jgi:hypothetical protein
MTPPRTAAELADLAVRSRLLDRAAVEAALRDRPGEPPCTDAAALADRLVRDNLLTPFQAAQLLEGRWRYCVLGNYKVLRPLASGGMGRVFLCEQFGLRRLVAVKVLPAEAGLDPAALKRFEREARAAGAMNHPNIVRAYEAGQDGSVAYLSMEYVPGASLGELVRQRGPLAPAVAAECARQAALGLDHAHRAGWVHRDVKPDNLLLTPDGVVKVLDLGLAKLMGDHTDRLTQQTGSLAVLGTVDYLAPEQVQAPANVDGRADVYGLGGTLFFLLTGLTPARGLTPAEKIASHLTQPPPSIRDLRPDVPEGLAGVLTRMLARDRDARYRTPAEAAEALAPWAAAPAALAGLTADLMPDPTAAAPPAGPPPSSRPRLWPLWAGMAIGAVVAAAAVGLAIHLTARPAVLTDAEAAARVGEVVRVELTVEYAALSRDGQSVLLASRPNPRETGSLTILIPKSAVGRFPYGPAADLMKHLHGKTIRLRGEVARFDGRPEIVVDNPANLEITSR